MSTTLTGEPQPMANGKASRVGDALAPPIPDWRHPQAVFDYKDARGNLLYQNVRIPLVTAEGAPVLSSKGKPNNTFRLRQSSLLPQERISNHYNATMPAVQALPGSLATALFIVAFHSGFP